jgi:catechol 2,3-dioxygenase-like lactoylglutathione lyase family enzyme
MQLTSTVILTSDLQRLASFYEDLLEHAPTWYRDDYAEFETEGSTLALFTVEGHDTHIAPGAAEAAANRSMKIEFEVADVDAVADRLRGARRRYDWVLHPPRDLPWGTRSIVLRDPEGHLIEIFAWQQAE